MFDLRPLYAFDASEGQIPEGKASPYGEANDHANCVPASFTAVLDLLKLGDIDPERVTAELYGVGFRGGFGNFQRMIAWVKANVPGAPAFSDEAFNFDRAEAAGQAGQLIVVAGWINPASVTFTAPSQANGFSHASLLVAHLAGDKYVIWNTWFGQMQTYDRAALAASLYEMSIVAGLHGAGAGSLGGDDLLPEERALLDTLWKHGPYHKAAFPATLVVQANLYNHPRTDAADVIKVLPAGQVVSFDSWMWTNVSSDQGRGPDYRWHHMADGSGWILANMCSTSLAPSIAPPDGEFDALAGNQPGALDVTALTASLVASLKPLLGSGGALTQAQADQLTQIVADAHAAAGVVPDVAAIAKHIGVGTP